MDRIKPAYRWVLIHLLIFCLSPLLFIITGLLAASVMAIIPFDSTRFSTLRLVIIILAPLLTGGLLGLATATFQIHTFRKLALQLLASRWIWLNGLGMALAFLAASWAYNASSLSNPLPLAAVLSGAIYGLATGFSQSRLLRIKIKYNWGWTLTTAIAGGFSFIFAIAPVWLAESALFWLVIPLSIASGMLYGLVTGMWVFSFSQLSKLSALVPSGVKEKTV